MTLNADVSLSDFLEKVVHLFKENGIERSWHEARLLLSFALQKDYTDLLFFGPGGPSLALQIPEAKAQHIWNLALKRADHYPLTKIMKRANFWKESFITTDDTLDPRPESELIIETLCHFFPDTTASLRFLDLGTGTGCLLLSALGEFPNGTGKGLDHSLPAIQIAQKNARALSLDDRATFVHQSWTQEITEVFDVILCNPPYIPLSDAESGKVNKEALFDPQDALFAGQDGLQAYREICSVIGNNMHEKSVLLFEIGQGQEKEVKDLLALHHMTCVLTVLDWQKIPRVLGVKLEGK